MRMLDRYRKKRKLFLTVYLAVFLSFSYTLLLDYIPDSISVEQGERVTFGRFLPVTKTMKSDGGAVESFSTNVCGTYQFTCRLFGLVPVKDVTVKIVDPSQVVPCGLPIGIYIETKGVLVVDTGEVEVMGKGSKSPARHILKPGDYITAVNGQGVTDKEELIAAVNAGGGEKVTLDVLRGSEKIRCEIQPVPYRADEYRIGAWVRDDLAGIGTMTYIDGNGGYGALGHGISDIDTEGVIHMQEGTAYLTDIMGIVKGKKGAPGELVGQIRYDESRQIGTIDKNTGKGIFGKLSGLPDILETVKPVSIGYKQEITTGPAQICFEIDGERKLYDVQIELIDMNAADVNKSLRFIVTDEELLAKTGGIVQGMSGSPILQNGKLIGAVTHVFVNDPSKGYGIFIEKMLEESGE